MSVKDYPSVDYVRQCLREENGRLFWIDRPPEHFKTLVAYKKWRSRCLGKEAGYMAVDEKRNYARWILCVNGVKLLRYTVVWALHHGEWRLGLDHENRISTDDRIENLRIANQSQNIANSGLRRSNTSGFKGAVWNKQNRRWMGQIRVKREKIYLGSFDTAAEAHAAYIEAAKKYFGEFACAE